MSELLPCPFCGGEAQMGVNKESTVREYFAGCVNCHIRLYKVGYKRFYTETEAISAWNARADTEYGAVPATDENMAKYGWVRERTCRADYRGGGYGIGGWYCSECGGYMHDDIQQDMAYCPNCGRRVVGE